MLQSATKLLSEQFYQFEYFGLFVEMTINYSGIMVDWPQHWWERPEIKPSKSQYIGIRTAMVITTMYQFLTMWDSDASTLYILYHI